MIKITLHYELTKKYHKGEQVETCCFSLQDYLQGKSKTLEHKIHGEWITRVPPISKYMNYSSDYCPKHFKEYLDYIDDYFKKKEKRSFEELQYGL